MVAIVKKNNPIKTMIDIKHSIEPNLTPMNMNKHMFNNAPAIVLGIRLSECST